MSSPSSWFHRWPVAWRRRSFRLRAAITLPFVTAVFIALPIFLQWVERRPGAVLADPVLALLPPVDLTWLIFGLIYFSIITAIIALTRDPERLLIAFQGYALMALLRIVGMFLTPLEPPVATIPLNDPFVQLFGSGEVLMKDLFFSGHTSTLCLLALTSGGKGLRRLFVFCTIAVALGVIIHHAHYAVDVFVAPFVAYASYRLVLLLNRRLDPEFNLS
jgi:hypothetical protein